MPRPGERVGFDGSKLVWQYLPGQGLQLHPLGSRGKANALWAEDDAGRLALLVDEPLGVAAARAGGLAWE